MHYGMAMKICGFCDTPIVPDEESRLHTKLDGTAIPLHASCGQKMYPLAEGYKADGEKESRPELLEIAFLDEVAKVMAKGAIKYEVDNWRKGMKWRRIIGAGLRHLFAFIRGESFDPETKLHHLAHLTCCAMFLYTYDVEKLGADDRVGLKK